MGTIHKHSTQSRNIDIMTNKNWTCIKMYKKVSKGIKSIKNIKVDNNYLCARTCDSDCSFTRVTELQYSASHLSYIFSMDKNNPIPETFEKSAFHVIRRKMSESTSSNNTIQFKTGGRV